MPEKKNYMKTNHRIPYLFRVFFNKAIFRINNNPNTIFLSFDDGPYPEYTPAILELLDKFKAKASFFCLGKNVELYPTLFQSILKKGHTVGNHTHSHINGFKSSYKDYSEDVKKASKLIKSKLFRPPYGNISPIRYNKLLKDYKIVFWDVMPGDFTKGITSDQLTANMIKHIKSGSIVVLHDQNIGKQHLLPALNNILQYYSGLGYNFCDLTNC